MKSSEKPSRGCLRSIVVFAVSVVLLAGAIVALDVRNFLESPVLPSGNTVHVVIPQGSNWSAVVEILRSNDVVRKPVYFDLWARRTGLPERVKAGRYTFVGPLALDTLAESLSKGGEADEVTVTIPEGLTIFHIADRLDEAAIVSRSEFLRAAKDTSLLEDHGITAESLEGYLFPDTYRFRLGASAAEIAQRMVARHFEVWNALLAQHPDAIQKAASRGLSPGDVVTLASLIERESGAKAERAVISRVFLNRIDKKMKLQTDPTCVYGEDTYKAIPHPKYCKDPLNRYSTYVIDGLPPGPIANPGRSSLEAALMPSESPEDFKYLFFVAKRDGTGRHHFTQTFEEHRKAVRKFLK
ncbi:MAG: endolytic transglycosylase MltG [bacterium]